MDVTISQFILEEFDVNCSLLDRLQETFLESSSVPFLGFDGPYCNATTDQIGTCWPRTSAGELVERPCPEFFNGIKYNTTSKSKPKITEFSVMCRYSPGLRAAATDRANSCVLLCKCHCMENP